MKLKAEIEITPEEFNELVKGNVDVTSKVFEDFNKSLMTNWVKSFQGLSIGSMTFVTSQAFKKEND